MNHHYNELRTGADDMAGALEGVTLFSHVSDRFFGRSKSKPSRINASALYHGPSTDAKLMHNNGAVLVTIPQYGRPTVEAHFPSTHPSTPEGYEVVGRNGTLHVRRSVASIGDIAGVLKRLRD